MAKRGLTMASVWDLVTAHQQGQQMAKSHEPVSPIWDIVNKQQISRDPTPKAKMEFGQPVDVPFKTDFRAAFSDNPEDRVNALAEHFQVDPRSIGKIGGKMGFFDGQKFVPFEDDFTDKAQRFTADMAGKLPPMVGAGAGALAGAATGNPIAITAGAVAGAGGGEYVRQKIGQNLFDDPVDKVEIGLESIFGAIGGGAGAMNRGYKLRQVAKDLSRLDSPSTQALMKSSKRWGVDLTAAELSNLPSLIRQQKLLGRLDATSVQMGDYYGKRRGDVAKALSNYLDTLAVEKSALEGNWQGVQAAKKHIDDITALRSQRAAPLYKQARERGATADVSDTIGLLDERISDAAGSHKSKLMRIKREMYIDTKDADGTVIRELKNDVGRLDGVKKMIDADIELAKKNKNNGLLRDLTEVKRSLVDTVDEVVSEYGRARDTFSGYSKWINETAKPPIEAIVDLKKQEAKKAGRLLFSSNNADPATVLRARHAIVSGGGEETWNGLVRAHITDVLETKMKDNITSGTNVGARIRKELFGSERQRSLWKAALKKTEYEALDDLMSVLEASGRAGGGESITAFAQESIKTAKSEASGPVAKIIRGLFNPLALPGKADELVQEKMFDKYMTRLVDAITSPDDQKKLRMLRALSSNEKLFTPAAVAFYTQAMGASAQGVMGQYVDAPLREDADYVEYIQQNYGKTGAQ